MICRRSIKACSALFLGATVLLAHGRPALAHDPSLGQRAEKAVRREMNLPVPDFSLTDQDGGPFSFRELRGKVVVVTFVYTSCPDVCPLITISLRQVQKELRSNERGAVFFLSVTTDPEIDSPGVLRSYGQRYAVDFSNWSFLTGEEKQLASVWKAFGVGVERKARGLVSHTPLTALVDEGGMMRFVYHSTQPDPDVILRDLRTLLSGR
ncbi:MAG: SCO family protein [Candidatus Binatia bacterium]